jgi:hypothetical protein
MKKTMTIRRAATLAKAQPSKARPIKPTPSKAEQDFNKAAELRRKFPLLAAAPAAKRRMRTAALAYAAELATKGGKR